MAYIGFKKLAAKVGPGVAAAIGRAKYGKKKYDKAAGKGKKLEGAKQASNKKENFKKLKEGKPSHMMKSGKKMGGAMHGKSKPHNVAWMDKHGRG